MTVKYSKDHEWVKVDGDIALLAELGFNLYRFSIEWARIEPEEGEFSFAMLEHYRDMLLALGAALTAASR